MKKFPDTGPSTHEQKIKKIDSTGCFFSIIAFRPCFAWDTSFLQDLAIALKIGVFFLSAFKRYKKTPTEILKEG